MDPNNILIVQIGAAVTTLVGAGLIVGRVIVPAVKRIRAWATTLEDFLSDWSGEEARAGRGHVPGVMERLNEIDGALKNNGGTSVKDVVDRIEKDLKELSTDTKSIKTRLEDGDQKFDRIESRINHLEEEKHFTEIKSRVDKLEADQKD